MHRSSFHASDLAIWPHMVKIEVWGICLILPYVFLYFIYKLPINHTVACVLHPCEICHFLLPARAELRCGYCLRKTLAAWLCSAVFLSKHERLAAIWQILCFVFCLIGTYTFCHINGHPKHYIS